MKKLKIKFVILFAMTALFCSCALNPPDPEICANLTLGGGFCKRPLSKKERTIPEPYWSTCKPEIVDDDDSSSDDNEVPCRPKMLLISPGDVAETLSFVEKVCDKYQNCEMDDVEDAKIFLIEMKNVIKRQDAK